LSTGEKKNADCEVVVENNVKGGEGEARWKVCEPWVPASSMIVLE
jgi:hypothetical protein